MAGEVVWNDKFGALIDWPEDDYVEIRWYDGSASLSTQELNDWLAGFARCVEQCARSGILVDATQFRMSEPFDNVFRDAHVIPRYNAAGVKKFAFLMSHDMPAIGAPPEATGPANHPTAYFGTRAEALAWLAIDDCEQRRPEGPPF